MLKPTISLFTITLMSAVFYTSSAYAFSPRCPSKSLDLNVAKQIIRISQEVAFQQHASISTTIIDNGGNLVAFERMEKANIGSIKVSKLKAETALYFRRPTKDRQDVMGETPNLSFLTFPINLSEAGGAPIYCKQSVIGAIGISGGTAEQDNAILTTTIPQIK